jgi:F-type H+-transporting ATPase subunit epsilon
MKTIPLEIITPDKIEQTGECEFIVLPGAQGELGILPGHAHCLAQLKAGSIRLTRGGAVRKIAIAPGIATIGPAGVKVVTSRIAA